MTNKKRILIVEDDEMLLEMYKEKLKMEGFKVNTVSDGKRALTKTKEHPDLILLDILMPGLNGFEVLKKIKESSETSDIPVIVLTNIGSESVDNDKKLAFSLGANEYMVKSLNTPDNVVEKINQILG